MDNSSTKNSAASALADSIEKVIVGKRNVIEIIIAAMLAEGHVLIEDVPGVGKTQLVSALARSCGGDFGRLQLTPDIMPSDISGFSMINPTTRETEFRKGAAFCNFLLADEINRASPKSQSALLEIMEEYQVSVDGTTYKMPRPFMVLATQNPVETYGTYHLPEAQMDRFMLKISIGYPDAAQEIDILERNEKQVSPASLTPVMSCEDITALSGKANLVRCSDNIKKYIIDIVSATRNSEFIKLGVSPRGSIAMYRVCKAYALVMGRGYVIPDDVKMLAPYVFSHRIMLSAKGKSALGSAEKVIEKIIADVHVPAE
ncbi:MAG: AAA family ATPase [Huintestinicola sp.]